MIRIVIADDHNMVRSALRRLLDDEFDIEVVGEAADGHQAAHVVAQLEPDVLIADVFMPEMDGIELAERVAQRHPGVRVLVISAQFREDLMIRAFRAGARGFLVKTADTEELTRAIREVFTGRRYLGTPGSATSLARGLDAPTPYESLTQRERDVVRLVLDGFSAAEIGDRLGITGRTVEAHRANAMHKIGVRSQVELVRWAIQYGIVGGL